MKDENKAKKQLIEELKKLRRQNQLNKKAESDRRKAEKELRESEQFSKNIINSMTDGFSILDEQGVHIDVNPAFCKMIGFKKEELIGVGPPHPYWPEEEYENIQKAFKKTTQGKFDEFKLVFKKKSGERFPVMVSPSQITDSKGNVTSIFATIKDITKSRKAEEELRASEKQFEDIALSSGDWIWEVDVDGKYTFASGRVEQILGYTPEELIGKAPFELMPENEAQRVGKIFQKIAAAKKPIIDLENKNLSKKGKLVYLLTNGVPIIDSNGNLTGYRGVDKDITGQKQAEQEIKIRNQIAKIFLTVPDEDMYADVLNIILESLDSKYGVFGYINEKGDHVVPSMTRRVWDQCEVKEKDIIFPKETWGKSSWAIAIREKKPNYSNKKSKLVPKGHVPIIRHMSMPIVHRGECIGLLQVANKKTDYDQRDLELLQNIADYIAPVLKARLQRDQQEKARNQAEEELRKSEEQYRAITSNLPGGLIHIFDREFKYVFNSGEELERLGLSNEMLLGKSIHEILPSETAKNVENNYRKVLKGETVRFEDSFGDDHFLVTATPLRDEKNKISNILVFSLNITERKKAEFQINQLNAELQSKNKELEQVLYATSHDLRSPLVNVQGFNRELQASLQELNSLLKSQEISETLKNKLKPLLEEDIPESLKYILTSTSKMDMLLSGLLTLSRLGRQKLTIKNLDMDKLMKDVVSTFEYEIKEKNIKLGLSPLPNCKGDELQINQVFSNLLGNAVKFIDPDRAGVIKISGKKKKDLVLYSVEDNGIGIPSNLQAKIFGLFHKLDTKTPGIGLGLTIVKQILDKHNGNIQIHSKKGKGTRITVSLPAKYKGDQK